MSEELKEITHKYDNDSGIISFYVNGKFFGEFVVDDGDGSVEDSVKLFIRIFNAGKLYNPIIEELEGLKQYVLNPLTWHFNDEDKANDCTELILSSVEKEIDNLINKHKEGGE